MKKKEDTKPWYRSDSFYIGITLAIIGILLGIFKDSFFGEKRATSVIAGPIINAPTKQGDNSKQYNQISLGTGSNNINITENNVVKSDLPRTDDINPIVDYNSSETIMVVPYEPFPYFSYPLKNWGKSIAYNANTDIKIVTKKGGNWSKISNRYAKKVDILEMLSPGQSVESRMNLHKEEILDTLVFAVRVTFEDRAKKRYITPPKYFFFYPGEYDNLRLLDGINKNSIKAYLLVNKQSF